MIFLERSFAFRFSSWRSSMSLTRLIGSPSTWHRCVTWPKQTASITILVCPFERPTCRESNLLTWLQKHDLAGNGVGKINVHKWIRRLPFSLFCFHDGLPVLNDPRTTRERDIPSPWLVRMDDVSQSRCVQEFIKINPTAFTTQCAIEDSGRSPIVGSCRQRWNLFD